MKIMISVKNKSWLIKGLLLLLALSLSLSDVSAKTRIMLISDPHVMDPGLLISEGEAWNEAVYYDRKLNDYSSAIFDEVIAIALREKPDLFLISGDLTKDGEWLSHQYVVRKLYELKAAGIRPFVVPGNHDMGTPNALYFDGETIYEADTINTSQFAELYRDFGYGEDVEREPTTLTWCCEPVDGLMLIGIDTGHDDDPLNGVISHTTYEWVRERAEAASEAGKKVFIMMHHALFPHVANADKFSSTYAVKLGLADGEGGYGYFPYATLRNHLADAGVSVVFSGHVHASDIAKDANKDLTRTVFDISTSSCAAYPNPYRLLTLNDDDATMRIETRYVSELPDVEDFDDIAEKRMRQGLVNLVKNITYDEDISNLFAEIFKIHVVGNEPEHPRQKEFLAMYEENIPRMKADRQLKDYLDAYDATFDDLSAMVYSMLEDRSNYGDPDRESLVDDLNTTIPVRGDGWTAIRPIVRETVGKDWYTLQGQRIARPSRKGIYIHDGKLSVVK